MKKLIIAGAIASALTIGGVALATTGNDNGHGDHGCHVGEKNNDTIINSHCPSPSPTSSVPVPTPSVSPSVSPSISPSPSNSPKLSVSPTPSPSVSPTPTPSANPKLLPATGGTGRLHP